MSSLHPKIPRKSSEESSRDVDKVAAAYESLTNAGQKREAACFLENVVKQLTTEGDTARAASIISRLLVGVDTGIDKKVIEKHYVSKILLKSDKPRIMFCSGLWLTGGMERVMSVLFDQLKDDYEIFLLTAYDGQQGKIEIPSYVTHLKMSVQYFWRTFDHRALSYALLFDIDVAIGFMNLFGGQLDFYALCASTRVKTIASNHEIYFYPYSNPLFFDLIQKRIEAYKHVRAALWLTNFSAAAYGLVGANSYLMPNPNAYDVQEGTDKNDTKIILCVGRFNDYIKRVDRMLECFSLVLKSHPDAKLILVGKCDKSIPIRQGEPTTINDLMRRLKLGEDKVVFVGEVENVEAYYSKSSLLLLTSTNEGFGMVINEAACFGVPTVANKIPGLEDLITDGQNGYLTDQDDLEAMSAAVNKILSDQKLRNRLGNNARAMVSRFDKVALGNKWKYLINTILEDSPDRDERLRKELDYNIDDYKSFSKLLFDELNKTIAVSRKERIELLTHAPVAQPISTPRRARASYHRLSKSLRDRGVAQTSKIVARKTYNKVRRIIKHS